MVDSPSQFRPSWNDQRESGANDWSGDRWSGRGDRRPERRPPARGEQRFEQRLDQWMTAGRQLVDGVAGSRPGSRAAARPAGGRGAARLRPGDIGRWVEDRLDWLLEDEDGWREPWQEAPNRRREPLTEPQPRRLERPLDRSPAPEPEPRPPSRPRPAAPAPATATERPGEVVTARGRRQPLDAISRRGAPLLSQAPTGPVTPPAAAADQDWPDDDSFSVSRWRRDSSGAGAARESRPTGAGSAPPPVRAVPRSSRRRSG
ncbi:MAG: hypothetical protein RLZZ219_1359 [Cyanobacteriota bacterium]